MERAATAATSARKSQDVQLPAVPPGCAPGRDTHGTCRPRSQKPTRELNPGRTRTSPTPSAPPPEVSRASQGRCLGMYWDTGVSGMGSPKAPGPGPAAGLAGMGRHTGPRAPGEADAPRGGSTGEHLPAPPQGSWERARGTPRSLRGPAPSRPAAASPAMGSADRTHHSPPLLGGGPSLGGPFPSCPSEPLP